MAALVHARRSRVLEPFRTVGVVCGDAPGVLHSLGTETFLVVPVGPAFHLYDADKLSLVLASSPLQADIECVAADVRPRVRNLRDIVDSLAGRSHAGRRSSRPRSAPRSPSSVGHGSSTSFVERMRVPSSP